MEAYGLFYEHDSAVNKSNATVPLCFKLTHPSTDSSTNLFLTLCERLAAAGAYVILNSSDV